MGLLKNLPQGRLGVATRIFPRRGWSNSPPFLRGTRCSRFRRIFATPPTASLCGFFSGDTPWLPLFWDKAMMVRKRRTFKKSLVIHRIEMLDISTQRRFVSCRFRRIFQSVKSKGQRPATQIYLQSPCRVTWQSIQSETHWGLETFGLVDITPLESTPKTPFFQNKKGVSGSAMNLSGC